MQDSDYPSVKIKTTIDAMVDTYQSHIALVVCCPCDILSQFVLRPKIQLRFRSILLKLLDIKKKS